MRLASLVLLGIVSLCLVQYAVGQQQPRKGFFDFFFKLDSVLKGSRIVGGTTTTIARYPYVVSLRRNSNHICAGSVISAFYVVTCAHCTASMNNVDGVTLYGGSTSRTTGGRVFQVVNITTHPEYNPDTFDCDVSVVRVSSSLIAFPEIATVRLAPLEMDFPAGTSCSLPGWGRTTDTGTLSATLRAVIIPVIAQTTCATMWSNVQVTDTMICAGAKGRDACIGDSGGPLVTTTSSGTTLLIGMVSWGSVICGSEYPGVHTRIGAAKVRNFLNPFL
uniref:Putative trypsin-like serine protease n=1 Tax=Anopheles braziliensis TaxID=58242 RepID=A0A2M3ZDL9_9DIPT